MENKITYLDQPVSYTVQGRGFPLVLLHGFLESKEMWNDYIPVLGSQVKVIAIDLPGHGATGQWGAIHSMEFMADVVRAVLDHESINKAIMIGHSMGGYVSLAFARKYPDFLIALSLFHSQAAADSLDAKANRDRTIAIIKKDRNGFISNFIPDLFAKENINRFTEEINLLKSQSLKTNSEGIIAALEGMKLRADSRDLLEEIDIPVMFIAGKKDNRIPIDLILKQASIPKHAELFILGDAGHMGFIEERDYCLKIIQCFIDRNAKFKRTFSEADL